ncbi:MAG: cysteine synthase A [Candidatus Micrarchaeia archaeon]
MAHASIIHTIGNTPIVRLEGFEQKNGAKIFAKLESRNPGGSVKDRIAKAMIESAEKDGRLRRGMGILEPTSGNTGIGLAMVGAAKGYEVTLVMPETMSVERRKTIAAFGAKIVLTEGPEANMAGAIKRANEIREQEPGKYFIPQQFENPANPQVHRETTAQEILSVFPNNGNLDAFVAGVGTGGTITGVGQVLRGKGFGTLIVAVEPEESPVLSGGSPGKHSIQGIGAGFVPKILDRSVISEIIKVSSADAKVAQATLARIAGIFAGRSSGAAVHAAVKIAERLGEGKTVLAVLPDTGERYLSME